MSGTRWAIFGPNVRGRTCGRCTACCTLVPVDLPEGKKLAGLRCRHICSRGCAIYASRPLPCQAWSCRWLFDEGTANMRRPDKTGYILDPQLDTVLADGHPIDAIQVWVDQDQRNAWRDPALLNYLSDIGKNFNMPAMIRWGSKEGFMLVPPSIAEEGKWLEFHGGMVTENEMKRKLAEAEAAHA